MKLFINSFKLLMCFFITNCSFGQVDNKVQDILKESRQAFQASNYSKSLLLFDEAILLDSSLNYEKNIIETKILLLIKNEKFELVYPQIQNLLETCYYSVDNLRSFKQVFLDKTSPFYSYTQTSFWEKTSQLIDNKIQDKNIFLDKIRGDISFFDESPLRDYINSYYNENKLSRKNLNQIKRYEFAYQKHLKNDTDIQLYYLKFEQDSIPFLVYVSPKFNQANEDNKAYIYIHGGANNLKDYVIDEQILNEPIFKKASQENSIVIYPLGKKNKGWKNNQVLLSIHKMYNLVSLRYNIRPKNTYVIGHSNGGRGVFWLAINAPGKWKHFLSIAPSYDAELVKSSLLVNNLKNVNLTSIHVEEDFSANKFYDSLHSSSKIVNWKYEKSVKKHGFIYNDSELEFFYEIIESIRNEKQEKSCEKRYYLHPEIPSLQSCFFYSPFLESKNVEIPIVLITKKNSKIDIECVNNSNFEHQIKFTFFSKKHLKLYKKNKGKCSFSKLNSFPWDYLDIDIDDLETKSNEIFYVPK